MDELFFTVVALLALAVPVGLAVLAIAAFVRTGRLETELRELRGRLDVVARRLREAEERPSREDSREPASPAPPPEPAGEPAAPPAPEGTAEERREPPPLPASLPSPPRPAPRPSPGPPSGASPEPAAGPKLPAFDLEKLLGGSLLVWIGGVALALAAAFFVKYSFEQGWVSPPIRIAGGLAFGLALIALGEWLRARSANVAQAACAAGVASLFAALLAGTNLYALIPPIAGFAGLALTTGAAVALSLRHGPFVAGLGLLGGFLTPALIRVGEPSPPLFFGYLFALQLGLLHVARRRGWWPVALLTLIGTHAWAIAWLAGLPDGGREPWLGLFVLAATAAGLLAVTGPDARERWGRMGEHPAAWILGLFAGVLGLGVLAATVHAAAFSNMEWGFLALLAAGALVLAWFDESYEALPWLTAAAGAVLLLDWSAGSTPTGARFAWIALAFGGLHAAGGWLSAWTGGRAAQAEQGPAPRSAARPAALSAAVTLAYLLVAWAELPDPEGFGPWGPVALVLATLHAAAVALERRGRADDAVQAAHAVAATALVSLALALEVRSESIAVAWALEVPALAWLHRRLRLPALKPLAAVVASLALALLVLNPATWEQSVGPLPVLDWLAWGFGVPCAAFAAAALRFRASEDDTLVQALEAGACALGAAWLALELRARFHDGRIDQIDWTLAELGLVASGWLLLGGLLSALAGPRGRTAVEWSGLVIAAGGAAAFVLGPLMGSNPLWTATEVAGPRVANTLLLAYLLPALLLAAWSAWPGLPGGPARRVTAASLGLVATFAFVTLEIRHWFHHPRLDVGEPGALELYAYSAAWILLGVALLAAGLKLGSKPLRQAALAVMLVAVAKVFLFDMRELEDLWRVVSFLGLGSSLLALGYLYQRFVLAVEE